MRFVFSAPRLVILAALVLSPNLPSIAHEAMAQQSAPATVAQKPETVEWVYRVRYGYQDEWFRIFRKYQIAILEKQKQLGYVKDYTIWAPGLHTSEESRWDCRVVITRVSHDAPPGESEKEVARQLFPDQTCAKFRFVDY
jgi:preprotein translocase subunit Sec63